MSLLRTAVVLMAAWMPWSATMAQLDASPLPSADGNDGAIFSTKRTVVSTEAALRSALKSVRDTQLIVLNTTSLVLNDTIPIVAAAKLTILGDIDGTEIRCPQNGSIFSIRNARVRLRRLTLKECRGQFSALSVKGGRLQSNAANRKKKSNDVSRELEVTVEECRFENNNHIIVAQGSRGGSAISATNALLQIIQTSFLNNSAEAGGGVMFLNSDVKIENSRFVNNSAESNGGSIFNRGGVVTIKGSTFLNGSAMNGGDIFVQKADVFIRDSSFRRSEAEKGGALFLSDVETKIQNTTFSKCVANVQGGAVSIAMSKADIVDVTFQSNRASSKGGALFVVSTIVKVLKSTLRRNRASATGGAIWLRTSRIDISASKITDNVADINGGASWSYVTAIAIDDSTFENNTAGATGGAVFALNSLQSNRRISGSVSNALDSILEGPTGAVSILGSIFTGNRAEKDAGAIFSRTGLTVMYNSTFVGNNCVRRGGAIFSQEQSCTMDHSAFEGNSANENGGAVFVLNSEVSVQDTLFLKNTADINAGGVMAKSGHVEIRSSNFTDNASKSNGGAVFLLSVDAMIGSTLFLRNLAESCGGGLSVRDGRTDIRSSNLTDNASKFRGGGICVSSTTSAKPNATFYINEEDGVRETEWKTAISVSDSIISNCKALERGGGIQVVRGNLSVRGSLFVRNEVMQRGGAIFLVRSGADVDNSTFDSNSARETGGAVFLKNVTMRFSSTVFLFNNAEERGGAISASESSLAIQRSTLDRNFVRRSGGAMQLQDCNLTAVQTQFQFNRASERGGAIFGSGSRTNFNNSVFRDNSVETQGGALALRSGYFWSRRTRFINNRAGEDGGAVQARSMYLMSMTRTRYSGNAANRSGGAISSHDCTLRIDQTTFLRNTANERGGALSSAEDPVQITQSIFDKNSAGTYGGAMHTSSDEATIMITTFINNHAEVGGGAIYSRFGRITADRVQFKSNQALNSGGAIFPRNCTFVITNANFSQNRAAEKGGAIHANEATIEFKSCNFTENSAAEHGGALYPLRSDTKIFQSIFVRNSVEERGGAVSAMNGSIKLIESEFVANSAEELGGSLHLRMVETLILETDFKFNRAGKIAGAIYHDENRCRISLSTFDNNTAGTDGGAVYTHFSNVEVDQSLFKNNFANEIGGGLYVFEKKSTIHNTIFRKNTARSFGNAVHIRNGKSEISSCIYVGNTGAAEGGAICFEKGDSTVTDSQFIKNKALETGGAVQTNQCNSMNLSNCTFTRNSAENGGALHAKSTKQVYITASVLLENNASSGGAIHLFRAHLRVLNTSFTSNEAVDGPGGAVAVDEASSLATSAVTFTSNVAKDEGGAVALRFRTTYSVSTQADTTFFRNNRALKGGGLACIRCDKVQLNGRFVFEGNAATKSGGGIHMSSARLTSKIVDAIFRNNNANLGGGATLQDCSDFVLGSNERQRSVVFYENVAINGGGLYLKTEHEIKERYEIQRSEFTVNFAVEDTTLKELSTAVQTNSPVKSPRMRQPAANCTRGCKQGKGGAIYVALRNKRDGSAVSVLLKNLDISKNYAVFGGGVYLEQNRLTWNRLSTTECTTTQSSRRTACQYVGMTGLHVQHNAAQSVAGGLFLQEPRNLSMLCPTAYHSLSHSSRDWFNECLRAENNRIIDKENGYGADIATNAAYLYVDNVNGTIRGLSSGELLVPPMTNATLNGIHGIHVLVRDHFNQTIRGGVEDAELVVVLESTQISGQRRYVAEKGEIDIKNSTVVGINLTETVEIRSEDEREISTIVAFQTLPCNGGELEDKAGRECIRCGYDNYTFSSINECRKCEDGAFCTGTTVLVPKDGYWHSNPYAPFMRRCLFTAACTGENRLAELVRYYNDSALIAEELSSFPTPQIRSDLYNQCADGYEGTLCGSCQQGYGHQLSGRCERCSVGVVRSRVASFFMGLILFLSLTVKVVLEIESSKQDALYELAEQKRVLDRESYYETIDEEESFSDFDNKPSSFVEQSAPQYGAIGSSIQERPDPSILRRASHVEDPSSFADLDDEDLSPEAMNATQLRTETYKILFNFIQLNSVALALDVKWRLGLRAVLTVQNSVGRLTNFAELVPFECNFSDTKGDISNPRTLTTLWYRACFPLITFAVYALIIQVWKRFRRKPVGRTEIDVLPPLVSLFLIVFVSSVIDIFGEFLRLLNCVKLSRTDHPYEQYETLEEQYVWVEDTQLICWEGTHLVAACIAATGVLICLGLTVFTAVILFFGKRRFKLGQPKFIRTYGFLYGSYRRQGLALYWESIITVRKMLMAATSVYAQYNARSNIQLGLLGVIIFAALWLHLIYQPFDHKNSEETFPAYAGSTLRSLGAHGLAKRWVDFNKQLSLNELESASLLMSISVFGTGLTINGQVHPNTASDSLQLAACIMNFSFLLFLAYRLWYAWHHCLDVTARLKSICFKQNDAADIDDDRNTWLLYKIMILLKTKPVFSRFVSATNTSFNVIRRRISHQNTRNSAVCVYPTIQPSTSQHEQSQYSGGSKDEEEDFEHSTSVLKDQEVV